MQSNRSRLLLALSVVALTGMSGASVSHSSDAGQSDQPTAFAVARAGVQMIARGSGLKVLDQAPEGASDVVVVAGTYAQLRACLIDLAHISVNAYVSRAEVSKAKDDEVGSGITLVATLTLTEDPAGKGTHAQKRWAPAALMTLLNPDQYVATRFERIVYAGTDVRIEGVAESPKEIYKLAQSLADNPAKIVWVSAPAITPMEMHPLDQEASGTERRVTSYMFTVMIDYRPERVGVATLEAIARGTREREDATPPN
jgi:hypothetical protein